MSPGTLSRTLEKLCPLDDQEAFTLYIGPVQKQPSKATNHGLPPEVQVRVEGVIGVVPEAAQWGSGAVVFGASSRWVVVLPPFPLEHPEYVNGWDYTALVDLLGSDRTIGAVLLRLGRLAVGVFHGQQLLASKTDTRYVKGRHHAGGTSQKRFERIRDKQVREMFDKTCAVVRERFSPFEGQMEYISLGGERHTLLGFKERCPYLANLSLPVLPRTLDVRVPTKEALVGAGKTIYESMVIILE